MTSLRINDLQPALVVFLDVFGFGNKVKDIQEDCIETEDGSGTGSHIIFDILWLEEHDIDLDKDGVFNPDEGDGDWDQDGVEDQLDKDTACIPIKNADPDIILIRKIYLDLTEQEGKSPSLKDVGFIDSNSLHIPLWLEHDSFLYS